jgi:tetratricopeptide (TPR) repeat protein
MTWRSWFAAGCGVILLNASLAAAEHERPADPSQWRRIALDRALFAAENIDDPYRRAEAFAGIARAQVLVDDLPQADRTIHRALDAAGQVAEPAFRGWVLCDVVLAQIAADDLLGARETASRIEAAQPQGAALAAIAEVQLRAGELEAATSTARKIRHVDSRGEALRQVVSVLAARGELDHARQLLRDIDDRFYLPLAIGDIAVAEVRAGKVREAHATAAKTKRSWRSQVYARIAVARAESGDSKGTEETLEKIDDDYARAVVRGRVALVRATAGETAESKAMFEQAIAAADAASHDPRRKVIALSQLARQQAAAGDPAGARRTLQLAQSQVARLEPGDARDETLDYLARGQARSGDGAAALQTALMMDDRIARALLVRDVVTLQPDVTSVIASQLSGRFEDPLIATAAQFGVLGVQLLRSGESMSADTIEAARSAVREIDAQVRPAAFAALAAARVKTGSLSASQSIFDEALVAADSLERRDQQAAAYVRVVNALNDKLIFLGQPASTAEQPKDAPRF